MAHFYGIVEGQAKAQATRRGTRNSGLKTIAASWQGSVHVDLYESDGTDYAVVSLEPWRGTGTSHELYRGPVSVDSAGS